MHLTSLLATSLALASSAPGVLAYPGMEKQLGEIRARKNDVGDSTELLGDLLTLRDSQLTSVGKDIKKLLTNKGNPESNDKYGSVPPMKSQACHDDPCCIWKYIADDMNALFAGKSGRCTKWARFAVRLGFHDAGAWSKTTAAQGFVGGADGSIILANELGRPENSGLAEIGAKMQQWYNKYNSNGFTVGMADLIQMGANVATVTCPLGPRIRSYVGRTDSSQPAHDGLLPDVNAPADELITLFQDKTIGPHALVALVGAHTTSQQHFVNVSRAGDPQDSTPGVWDVLFYSQTTGNAPKRVFKFPSDVALAAHPLTQPEWADFSGGGGQSHWNEDFARYYIRLSLLGVNNINQLTECTKVLPPKINNYKNPDQKKIDKWLDTKGKGSGKNTKIADDIDNGDVVVDDAEPVSNK